MELSKADYQDKYNDSSTGLFKTNTDNSIGSNDLRSEVEDTSDSFVGRVDECGLVSVSTSGDITLDFGSLILAYFRRFVGSASFAVAKNVTLSNSTNANHFTFIFEITHTDAVLDFGAGSTFISGDGRFTSADQKFTPDAIGKYKITGDFDGTNWFLDFNTLPYA